LADEYYLEDRPAGDAALEQIRLAFEEHSRWSGYLAEGLKQTLEPLWFGGQRFQAVSTGRMVLTPKQNS
jgi:hypothetical protein